MSDFHEIYKHPLWQQRRLKILSRDHWTCLHCRATGITLHVDHVYYVSGRKPWEYPEWALRTLCEQCHEIRHRDSNSSEKVWECVIGSLASCASLGHPLFGLQSLLLNETKRHSPETLCMAIGLAIGLDIKFSDAIAKAQITLGVISTQSDSVLKSN
jgi:hypothetical protein